MMKNNEDLPEVLFDKTPIDMAQDCACPHPVLLIAKQNAVHTHNDGDCACSSSFMTLPLKIEKIQLYHASKCLIFQPLRDGYEAVYNPFWPGGFGVINKPAKEMLQSYQSPRPLPSDEAHTVTHDLVSAGLLIPVINSGCSLLEETPDTLTAWLHVTERCNLRCQYCYVRKKNETMSIETGSQAVRAVFRTAMMHGFSKVQLKFAGGEPTLAFDTLLAMQSLALETSKLNQLDLDGVVLSNGVGITPTMARQFRENDLRLSISLDGWGREHDLQRSLISGQGSFGLVQASLEVLARERVKHSVTITLTSQNLEGLPGLVSELLQRDIPFNFNFYRSCSSTSKTESLPYSTEGLIEGLRAAFEVIKQNPPNYSLLNTLLDRSRFGFPHHYPCGVGKSYMVVGTRGDISKCHMQMDEVFGNITNSDPLQGIRTSTEGLQNPDVDTKPDCRACEWRYSCSGGCPLANYYAYGSYYSRSPNCVIYRTLGRAVLKLEGIRVIERNLST